MSEPTATDRARKAMAPLGWANGGPTEERLTKAIEDAERAAFDRAVLTIAKLVGDEAQTDLALAAAHNAGSMKRALHEFASDHSRQLRDRILLLAREKAPEPEKPSFPLPRRSG